MTLPKADIVLCVASGPSLVASDIVAARKLVDTTICVSDAWRMAPDCEHLFSADRRWWQYHYKSIRRGYRGAMWTSNEWSYADYRIPLVKCPGTNSGIKAMNLARLFGASRMYLLGYDFGRGPDGEKHFFGDHPMPLPNTSMGRFPVWVEEMRQWAKDHDDVSVINLSRRTAIDCFPRGDLA